MAAQVRGTSGEAIVQRRRVCGQVNARGDSGLVSFDSVGLLNSSFELHVPAMVGGRAETVTLASGACEVL